MSSDQNQLKALIFDVDGTLAETERDGHRPAFNQAFLDAGLDWNWSEERYGELLEVSGGKERIRAFVHQSRPDFVLPDGFEDLTAFINTCTRARRNITSNMPRKDGFRCALV